MDSKELRKAVLTLPDPQAKGFVGKRAVKEPDITVFKNQQAEVFQLLLDYVEGRMPDWDMFLLQGYAGTGKTFVISRLMELLLFRVPTRTISATAPTNKAVKVARNMSEYVHSNLDFQTIHQLLGLKPTIDKDTGEEVFAKDYDAACSIEGTKVLIVDEVSMLNDDLFVGTDKIKGIAEYVQELGIKIIMVGDPAQIPPVNKPDCIPFTPLGQDEYKIYRYVLTEPVRQAIDSPIYQLTNQVRDNLHKHTAIPDEMRVNKLDNFGGDDIAKGVVFFDTGEYEQGDLLDEVLQSYFCSKNYKQDADFIKVVAWRNKTVAKLNRIIRGYLFQEEASEKLVVGEKLIANKPIQNEAEEYIVFTTNDEFTVRGFRIQELPINGGQYRLKYYDCQVDYTTIDNNIVVERIKVIHEESQVLFDNILKQLADYANKQLRGTFKYIKAWEEFHTFKKTFADVSYNYAITGHKSQGSTYDNAIVLENDIDFNKAVVERNRIKYTAMSRPRHKLFVVH